MSVVYISDCIATCLIYSPKADSLKSRNVKQTKSIHD